MQAENPWRVTSSRIAAFHALPPRSQTVWQAHASRFRVASTAFGNLPIDGILDVIR